MTCNQCYLYSGCYGWNAKEYENIPPWSILWLVMLDVYQYSGCQLDKHVYAQYDQIEYGCWIGKMHCSCKGSIFFSYDQENSEILIQNLYFVEFCQNETLFCTLRTCLSRKNTIFAPYLICLLRMPWCVLIDGGLIYWS